jgi:hypothetical protein
VGGAEQRKIVSNHNVQECLCVGCQNIRRDAARFRFLIDPDNADRFPDMWEKIYYKCYGAEQMCSAIDAAMIKAAPTVGTAVEPHTCPYKVDINDDSETLCTCGPEKMQDCRDDI